MGKMRMLGHADTECAIFLHGIRRIPTGIMASASSDDTAGSPFMGVARNSSCAAPDDIGHPITLLSTYLDRHPLRLDRCATALAA